MVKSLTEKIKIQQLNERKNLNMTEWFKKQSKVVRIILMIIPMVNWVIDIVIRIEALIKKQSTNNILGLVLYVFFGYVLAFVDLIMVIIDKDFLLVE